MKISNRAKAQLTEGLAARRARWDWIKTLHPQTRPGRWRKPAPTIPAPTAGERRVMRDSTRSKRARRDREAMAK